MIARSQRLFAFMLVAISSGWVIYALSTSRPRLATLGAVAFAVGYSASMAAEFVVLWFVQTNDAAPRPSAMQLVDAWWHELITAPRVFLWRQPFCSDRQPDKLPAAGSHPSGRGVVMVHGFFCNRGLWNGWLAGLHARNVPCLAVNLEPVFGSIDQYIDIIDAAVGRLQSATGLAPLIVAHSMGGLAVRRWWADGGNEMRVHRLITIATPHHGTWLARFALTENGRQMRQESPWLAALAAFGWPADGHGIGLCLGPATLFHHPVAG